MRRQNDGQAGFIRRRLPTSIAVAATFAVVVLAGIGGCGKKDKDSDIQALEPDFKAISDQLKRTALESGVRKTPSGDGWTKFLLEPVSASFRLTRTLSESEPYRLMAAVKYRMHTYKKPFATEALARDADFKSCDAVYELPVTVEFVFQDDRWYLNTLSSQPPVGGPIDAPAINALLRKSIRRML